MKKVFALLLLCLCLPISAYAADLYNLDYKAITEGTITNSTISGMQFSEITVFNVSIASKNGNKYLSLEKTGKDDDESLYEFVKNIYAGHEIANHTVNHYPVHLMEGETSTYSNGGKLVGVSLEDEIADVIDCSQNLKKYLGADEVTGLAWPNGYATARADYDIIEEAVKAAGIRYARAAETGGFSLPEDWMRWGVTCHHNNAMSYAPVFTKLDNEGELKCFFVWGHAYELANDTTGNCGFDMLENVLITLSADENIRYMTNGEVYKYMQAMELLQISDQQITNNSDITLYLQINGTNTMLSPGETYSK